MESIMRVPLETSTFPNTVDHAGLMAAPVLWQVGGCSMLCLSPPLKRYTVPEYGGSLPVYYSLTLVNSAFLYGWLTG